MRINNIYARDIQCTSFMNEACHTDMVIGEYIAKMLSAITYLTTSTIRNKKNALPLFFDLMRYLIFPHKVVMFS